MSYLVRPEQEVESQWGHHPLALAPEQLWHVHLNSSGASAALGSGKLRTGASATLGSGKLSKGGGDRTSKSLTAQV